MRKWHCMTALALALASGAAFGKCKTVLGYFEAQVIAPGTGHCPAAAPFCTAGRVWGGIRGNYQFVMSGLTPSATLGGVPTIVFFAGRSTVFLKRGGQVMGTDTGSIDLPPGDGGFASLITFDGNGGQLRLQGEFDAAEGTTSGTYIGSFCTG
jgi:hypothetical protein